MNVIGLFANSLFLFLTTLNLYCRFRLHAFCTNEL